MEGDEDTPSVPLNVCWITVRKVSDLCSTTTLSLAAGISEAGHNLTILNPDQYMPNQESLWSHYNLKQSKIRGLQASSVVKSAIKWFVNHNNPAFDLILLDWQLARKLVPFLNDRNYRMMLIDRSPPADMSILSKFQWKHWKYAWKCVSEGIIARGCVVSQAHYEFVQQYFSDLSNRVHIIPAGVDTNLFKPAKKPSLKDEVRLFYHGRLDKHRGVMALPMLAQKLQNEGINAKLTLIGEGDVLEKLENISRANAWLSVLKKMKQNDLAPIINTQHIGLLPMPEYKIWALASPLKRSEFLSSGLLVLGLKHSGHTLENTESSWFQLIPQHAFHDLAVEWIKSLNDSEFEEGSERARTYAKNHCSWKYSTNEFNSGIQSAIREA
jgi:glycosyltransferase involved in cell wall biosynthesis